MENGLQGPIDRNLLIVARALAAQVIGGRKEPLGIRVVGKVLSRSEALPELAWSWKHLKIVLFAGEKVELDDAVAVGRICKLQPEHFRITFGLLESVTGSFVCSFRLDNRDHAVASVPQEIVGAFLRSATGLITDQHDATVGERLLFSEGVWVIVPTSLNQLR